MLINPMHISLVQKQLLQQGFDGWLIYDFQKINPFAQVFLEIPPHMHITRRFFYWIPAKGEPVKILHRIEPEPLKHLPGRELFYLGWKELKEHLKTVLQETKIIAMEYSPKGHIPSISRVDAGTFEIVRDCNVEIVSSALLSMTPLDAKAYLSHVEAASVLENAVEETWKFITEALEEETSLTEYDVQTWILKKIKERDCAVDGMPICATAENSSNPHYSASLDQSRKIKKGDLILIDLSCKRNLPNAIFADITRMAIAGHAPTKRQNEIFSIVRKAQQTATQFVKKKFHNREIVRGYEVDQVARNIIEEAGYGMFFTHRTGHNLGTEVHGSGTHLDGFETFDDRPIVHCTLFTIEPGIYIPQEFGIRLEYDVFVEKTGSIKITGGVQEEIYCLF